MRVVLMRQDWIQQNEETIIGVSKKIWGYAELGRHEYKSSACLQELLRENGFQVTTGLGGLETSIKAEWGNGEPVIGFLGEFDALPDLSQKTVAHRSPLVENAPGHGCGHNLLGTSAAAAAIALRYEMEEQGLPGTVIFWGCPDEEGTMGKIYMARKVYFPIWMWQLPHIRVLPIMPMKGYSRLFIRWIFNFTARHLTRQRLLMMADRKSVV